jgi:hypothetical protein
MTAEKLNERFTKMNNCFCRWTSIDDARSYAMETQYAIDHPEDSGEDPLTPKQIEQAKAYIRSAKEYLAARDESL